jgi:dUTP pyrophosphatase
MILGADAKEIEISATGTAIARPIPRVWLNGSAASRTIGDESKRAATVPFDGVSRSENSGLLTPIDYAQGVNLEVLLVSEPGFEPSYAKPGDAGADLRSFETLVLAAGARALVRTGIRIAMPDGYVGLVHPRSGLAVKHGITVLNSPGTIDAGYRGEIMVPLLNTSTEDFQIEKGDRIAQILFQQVEIARFVPVTELPESSRGETGFGSSGKS